MKKKKHPIQKIRKPMPPPTKKEIDKKKEEEKNLARKKVDPKEEGLE
ncbi:MAG: hypothetical protein KC931_04465 [Candidatus Omnitrophica bacterium]|nr:hypothetical protein [Candidatus Omnitrophota bacterium]MCA9431109.1 hypothetical protein [Candidatus Omnitrophota bacterium]MCA9444145.1 hypothetical protein [Candidatus Omnitrophota bacterium]MCA9446345.1 hypothetical protein [Candidatus Omnitrophota bacterium]MCB9769796.1 hypothetical protein [Candidatus Omnitrophota bacterium]